MGEGEHFDRNHASVAGYQIDPLNGAPAWIVPTRQDRPNLPVETCPFCVGGLEAPDDYEVLAFPNRWPPFENDRAEIEMLWKWDGTQYIRGVGALPHPERFANIGAPLGSWWHK